LSSDRFLEIYLIAITPRKVRFFAPSDILELLEAHSTDHVRRFTAWLQGHRYRILAWLGKVFESGRGYYVRLEARLDPLERVLKSMDSADRYNIYHSTNADEVSVRKNFFARLRRQCAKHVFWCVLDLLLSIASLAIAFLPGPNVVGWYPFLRSLSHYGAYSGTRALLRSQRVTFKGLQGLRTLEENLQAPGFDRKNIHAIAEEMRISGLEQFLERMV